MTHDKTPNAETLAAMEEADELARAGSPRFKTIEALFGHLGPPSEAITTAEEYARWTAGREAMAAAKMRPFRIEMPDLTDAEREQLRKAMNQPGGEIVHYTPGMDSRFSVDGTTNAHPIVCLLGPSRAGPTMSGRHTWTRSRRFWRADRWPDVVFTATT